MDSKANLNMGVDEHGMPVLSYTRKSWFASLLSASAYYVRRVFKSKEERDKEQNAVKQFASFLKRIKLTMEIDSMTGVPVVSLILEESPSDIRRRQQKKRKPKNKHVVTPVSKPTKKNKNKNRKRQVSINGSDFVNTAWPGDGMGKPLVVEDKHGNIVYHIHHLIVHIHAEVVTQLNTNPQQVINVIQDKVQVEIDKMVKEEGKKEDDLAPNL